MEDKKLTQKLINVAENKINRATKNFFVIGMLAANVTRDGQLSFENSQVGYYVPGYCDRMDSEPDTWTTDPFSHDCARFSTFEQADTFIKNKLGEKPYVIGRNHFLGEFCYYALKTNIPDNFNGYGVFFIQEIKTTIPVATFPIEKIIAVNNCTK